MYDILDIAMRNCIIYFLNRRLETVVQILIERRAPLLKHFAVDKSLNINLEPYCQAFYENEEAAYLEQSGIWNGEWQYYFHGHGCRLTHIQTGEYFDWDASDPRHFYAREFAGHLKWRVEKQPNDPDIAVFRNQNRGILSYWEEIERILDNLLNNKILGETQNEFGQKVLKLLR
jgi:hypothetical protein